MSIQSKFYFWISGEWVYQGATSGTSWSVSSLDLQFAKAYLWRVDTYDTETELTTTGDTWSFTTLYNYPYNRPDDYNPDLIYATDGSDPATLGWGDIWDFEIQQLGGGRYKKNLVAVNNKGKVYFSETE